MTEPKFTMRLILNEYCYRCPAVGVFCERPKPLPFPSVPCPLFNDDKFWYLRLMRRWGIEDWIVTGPFSSRRLTLDEAIKKVKKVKSEEENENG